MPRTPAQANLDAEVRAVEAGHHAVAQPGGWVRVISDTYRGKTYRVEFRHTWHADGDVIAFSCAPEGRAAYSDDHRAACAADGIAPCMHAALAARRLEREGLAVLSPQGRWAPSARALAEARDRADMLCPADPLEGLPR